MMPCCLLATLHDGLLACGSFLQAAFSSVLPMLHGFLRRG